MASRKIFHPKPNYTYPTSDTSNNSITSNAAFEFSEEDIWSSNHNLVLVQSEAKKTKIPSHRSSKKKIDAAQIAPAPAASSLPVSVPDWSKILKNDYEKRESREDVEIDDECDDRIPPHEYLARRRGASLSVHEGIGRTLKGRDLRRVRNAIWKKTGFED